MRKEAPLAKKTTRFRSRTQQHHLEHPFTPRLHPHTPEQTHAHRRRDARVIYRSTPRLAEIALAQGEIRLTGGRLGPKQPFFTLEEGFERTFEPSKVRGGPYNLPVEGLMGRSLGRCGGASGVSAPCRGPLHRSGVSAPCRGPLHRTATQMTTASRPVRPT
jgi:hypothetical protein